MAAIFVGKAVATAVITNLVTKSLDYLKDQLSAPDKAKLQQSLTSKLTPVQAIFDAVDQNTILEAERPALDEWLWQLRTAIEKADEALDELEYYNLEKETSTRKLSTSSRLLKLHLGPPMSLKFRSTLKKLKIGIEGLDSVLSGVENFIHIVNHLHRQDILSDRETGRRLMIHKVFGRGAEKEQLVQWLTTTRSARENVVAIAIIGFGGMGKTTLVQFVCEDGRVLKHFSENIVWIHVSKQFDPAALMRKILESITKKRHSAETLDVLQACLEELLLSRRFLLILDDAWEDSLDHYKWQQFLAPLCNAVAGSRILITTRMRSVVCSVEYVMERYGKQCLKLDLDGLGNKDLLDLFKSYAFAGSNLSDHQELQLMSEQIVKKLTGCPLAATAVGQQLWNEKDHMQWSSILNKKSPHIAVPSVMEVLKLSYQNLPPEVQICFRYCALFPPHYKFSMEELIDMWVGSGLILQRHEDIQKQNCIFSVEATAREYFNLLERKSFLSIAAPGEDHYVMHTLVYQLACSISSKEVLWLESADSKACVPPTVRHLSIEGINYEVIKNLSQAKELRLRTLVIKVDKDGDGFNEPRVAENINKLIKGSKGLRLLSLHGRNCSVLKIEFSKLKHLRYVSMSNVNRSDLYKVFKLYHLEIIRIQSVSHKGKMGLSGIGNLLQLRKLDLPKGTVSRIRHIGRLTTLQELNGFSVNAEEGHKIDELRDLMRLQKISVLDVQNVSDRSEANAAELHAKTDMRLLSLEWDSNEDYCDDDQTLENLSPNKDLKQLMICGYDGGIQPSWMNIRCLPNLVHLKLDGCAGWVDLPTLRILHTLRHLFLVCLYKLGHNDSFYVPIFRSRRRRDEGMGYIGDWMPPFLATLVVKECPALSKLPDLPLSLCLLDISQAGLTRLPTMCDSNQLMDASTQQPQLSDLHIESCQFLDSSLDDCLLPMGRYRALTNLSVIHCKNLNSLPAASVFRKMSKMETVEVDDCESLSSLGGLGALRCLRELKIKRCPNLVASSSQFPSIVGPSMLLGIIEVDKHALLHVKPLSDLNSTRSLVISDGLGMTTLPINWLERNIAALESIEVRNAAGLESLPLEIDSFLSLRSLSLTNASVLEVLPIMPPNLWDLSIKGCHTDFKRKYQRGGCRWRQISRIPVVNIS